MLTTFNELTCLKLTTLEKNIKRSFIRNMELAWLHVFFTKTVVKALQDFPDVNSMIDGEEIINYEYQDISIAVSTQRF